MTLLLFVFANSEIFYNISQGSSYGLTTIMPCEVLTFHLTVEELIHIMGNPADKDKLQVTRRISLIKLVCGAVLVAVGP